MYKLYMSQVFNINPDLIIEIDYRITKVNHQVPHFIRHHLFVL